MGSVASVFFFFSTKLKSAQESHFWPVFRFFHGHFFFHTHFLQLLYITFFTPTFFLTGTFFVFFHGYYHTVFRTGCIFHGHKFDFFRHLPKKSTGTDIFDKTGTGDFYYTREQTREHFCSRDSWNCSRNEFFHLLTKRVLTKRVFFYMKRVWNSLEFLLTRTKFVRKSRIWYLG